MVSDETAARLHGIPLPPHMETDDVLHLTRPAGSAAIDRKGVCGHRRRLLPSEIVQVGSIRLTSVVRAWMDMAGRMDLDDLVAAADWMVSEYQRDFGERRVPKVPLAELHSYVAALRGNRFLRRAEEALELTRVGVDSPPETRLRLMMLRGQLPEFAVNCRIDSPRIHRAVWADLGARKYRVCVEYDGLHHLTPEQQALDNERDALTALAGWRQIKINRLQLRQPGSPCLRLSAGHWWITAGEGRGPSNRATWAADGLSPRNSRSSPISGFFASSAGLLLVRHIQ
ncbi:hypothetical protein OL239_04460 [Arthrobacter sp. ATA002]|uniref:hypothetical protein n=1 Tax=Arthrobacter sp. ATA002 TaxID=2991715 RepID=UPI0022A71242|nr:hypothetical protein [Arthrobacter sp. ATA002]WAP52509.1 hypothetical protein OL239_04460 [Arthrobacter sp. ATA002]